MRFASNDIGSAIIASLATVAAGTLLAWASHGFVSRDDFLGAVVAGVGAGVAIGLYVRFRQRS